MSHRFGHFELTPHHLSTTGRSRWRHRVGRATLTHGPTPSVRDQRSPRRRQRPRRHHQPRPAGCSWSFEGDDQQLDSHRRTVATCVARHLPPSPGHAYSRRTTQRRSPVRRPRCGADRRTWNTPTRPSKPSTARGCPACPHPGATRPPSEVVGVRHYRTHTEASAGTNCQGLPGCAFAACCLRRWSTSYVPPCHPRHNP